MKGYEILRNLFLMISLIFSSERSGSDKKSSINLTELLERQFGHIVLR